MSIKKNIPRILCFINVVFIVAFCLLSYKIISTYEEMGIISDSVFISFVVITPLSLVVSIAILINSFFHKSIIYLYVFEVALIMISIACLMIPIQDIIGNMK